MKNKKKRTGRRLRPPLEASDTENHRDGRLTVLLAFAACFLATVFTTHNFMPMFSSGITKECERLAVSDAGFLLIEGCGDTPEFRGKGNVPWYLSPFFYEPVQINIADKEMLMTVKGVGPALAGQILAYRKINGVVHSPLDLQKLRGVGRKKADAIASEFDFTEGP